MNKLQDFTNLYSLSKTLRFELIPVGKTEEHIQTKGLLSQDEQRAESYKKVKKIIDKYHKSFIERALTGISLTKLNDFYFQYKLPKEQRNEDAFEKIKESLRKEIVAAFGKSETKEQFDNLFKKELIKEDLLNWVDETNQALVKEFEQFTTYFTGFHTNRKNMYSSDEKSTAIAYRVVHENLPKFIDNIRIYEGIKSNHKDLDFSPILSEMEEVIQGKTLDEIFTLDFFNNVLSQNGIDFINYITGGRSEKAGEKKIKGLNEYINLYNQQQKDKKNRATKLKPLYKQILSDRSSISWLPEAFKADVEVLDTVNGFYREGLENAIIDGKGVNILNEVERLLKSLSSYDDWSKIYLCNDTTITTISQTLFDDYDVLGRALNYYYEKFINPAWITEYAKANETKREKLEKERNKFTKSTYISIATLQTAVAEYVKTLDDDSDIKQKYTSTLIIDYFVNHCYAKDENGNETKNTLTYQITSEYNGLKGFLNTELSEDYKLIQDKERVHQLKVFLDSIMNLLHFVKPLYVDKNASEEKNELFYAEFTPVYDELARIIPLYNMVRNYLTQKPYSTEKFKLNFENGYLLSGWGTDYTTKAGLIVVTDDNYYLVIIDKTLTKEDVEKLLKNTTENPAKRMVYDFQKPDNKNIPRLFIRSKGENFAPAVQKYNLPINNILNIYDDKKFTTEYRKKDDADFKYSLKLLIDYFKEGFQKHESYKHYSFAWKPSGEYNDIAAFYKDVESSCYRLSWEDVNFNAVIKLAEENKLYLFQIYNKDFSEYSKGKPNLHTLYWKSLFAPENLADVVYKLNGQAELFFRKKSIKTEKTIVHKAQGKIENKNPRASKKSSTFDYDIIKDRRYTVDKFQFHVPITMNFKAPENDYINPQVNEFLRNNPDVKIIGLDRGERHLIYLTLIDQQGNIIQQESLNTIKDEEHKIETPYHELLDKKEKERDDARKSWGTIENIKELKEGYISQVVHKIAKMMIDHNAIVVLEDLNFGFKRGRFRVEKQVYQKLEKMLIDKLNYLVIKDNKANEAGGIYKALQLTNKFKSFKDMGKQTGFLFYVPANYTSAIDPTTGFVDFIKPKYESIEQAKTFLSKFEEIRFNKTEKYFEFLFDYKKFTTKADDTITKWTICAHGERIEKSLNSINKWDDRTIILNNEFTAFFDKYQMDYKDGKDLKEQILQQTEKAFFEKLLHLLRMTLQMRNSKTGTEIDYLISPIVNKSGNCYDSRKAVKNLPQDADANGAYHIALKGLWILQKGLFKLNKKGNPELAISNKEWLQFAQEGLLK